MSEKRPGYYPDPPTTLPGGPPPPPPPGFVNLPCALVQTTPGHFETPTQCLNCSQDLTIAMRRRWEALDRPAEMFDFVCPNCGAKLLISVDLQPWFRIVIGGV